MKDIDHDHELFLIWKELGMGFFLMSGEAANKEKKFPHEWLSRNSERKFPHERRSREWGNFFFTMTAKP